MKADTGDMTAKCYSKEIYSSYLEGQSIAGGILFVRKFVDGSLHEVRLDCVKEECEDWSCNAEFLDCERLVIECVSEKDVHDV